MTKTTLCTRTSPRFSSLQLELDRLASKTDAPDRFVRDVRSKLESCGLSLHEPAAPYSYMLERIFLKEAAIREDRDRVRTYLRRVREMLADPKIEQTGKQRLSRLWQGLEHRSVVLTNDAQQLKRSIRSFRP